ncbi:MAG: hypothetical protein FWF52_05265 [Candidatus Azobacteroides sp.]|nr:hypothetical protein [Candidatus Azobacteroides sp.]
MYHIPVLFIIFANPNTTVQVFEQIRQIQPTKLYVAADAPRLEKQDEIQRSIETRNIINRIDWHCELKTLFQDKNLGAKIAVSKAITWFFEHEEQGVILEHDCLPDPSFFPYCEKLLNKYKEDTRIGHIGGNNFLSGIVKNGLSYDFCSYPHIWGWATWRRVWKNYDVNFPFWEEEKEKRSFLFYNQWEKIYFSTFISDVLYNRNGINTWDTQYWFTLRLQNQLSIYPSVNMVTNIGLGDPNALHTAIKKEKLSVPVSGIHFPLRHPQYVLRNRKIDDATTKKLFFSWKRLVRYFLNQY